jgi:hypothetical protein
MGLPTVVGNEVAVAVSFDGSSGASVVATSADGGQTWRTQVVPGLRQPAIVDLIDPTHWIGTDGTILVSSHDGGTHWKRWKPAVAMRDASGTPLMLDFLSPTLGWAVSRDAGGPLWWTTDGGRTWMPIAVVTTSQRRWASAVGDRPRCGQTLATISSANQCTGPRRAASALSSGVPGAMSANIQGAHTKSVTPASAKRR